MGWYFCQKLKKLVSCNRDREILFGIILYIFDKWRKSWEKVLNKFDEKILMLCADGSKRSSLTFFLVNNLYLHSFTLEPDLFSS